MKLELGPDELRPLVAAVVAEMLSQRTDDAAKLTGRLSYPEAEAASLLGVAKHSLRDCRLAGQIKASKVGRRVVYRADELKRFLLENEM